MGGATQLTLMLVELRLRKQTSWGGDDGTDGGKDGGQHSQDTEMCGESQITRML